MSLRLFISYSHRDGEFRDCLEAHLAVLKSQGHLSTWTDRRILPSQDWNSEIDTNLKESDLIILLLSADFFASGYCTGVEMVQAEKQVDGNKSRIIPIIVRTCDWKEHKISKYQALPTDAIPISKWDDKD